MAPRDSLAARTGDYEAAIFDAHLLFLEDEALLGPARAAVHAEGRSAARASADAIAAGAAAWEALDDAYLRARAADLHAVGDQVLHHLLDEPGQKGAAGALRRAAAAGMAQGVIVAADLYAGRDCHARPLSSSGSRLRLWRPHLAQRDLGTRARDSRGRGRRPGAAERARGHHAALSTGSLRTITVDPPPNVVRALAARRGGGARRAALVVARAGRPAVTRDGVAVRVTANVAAPAEVAAAVAAGADGIGLLRTEFLFLTSDHLPAEDEQEKAYRAVAEGLGGRPFTLRTFDAGADSDSRISRWSRSRIPAWG